MLHDAVSRDLCSIHQDHSSNPSGICVYGMFPWGVSLFLFVPSVNKIAKRLNKVFTWSPKCPAKKYTVVHFFVGHFGDQVT